MPHYIIEREVGEINLEDLPAVGRKSNEVLAEMEGVVWIRSYISQAEGKIYCEYEAPNPEAVYEHARRAGIPAKKGSESTMESEPSRYR